MRRRGLIVILSSPSGAGKTTLTRMLLQDKALDLSLVDIGDDAAAALVRGRRRPLSFHRSSPVRSDEGGGRPARIRRGPRQLLRHAARAGDADARRRARRAVRHRLAGRAAGARGARGATSSASSSCRRRWRSCARGSIAAPRIRRRRSRSGWRTPSARSSAGASTTTSSSTTICSAPTAASSAIIAAERARGSRVAEGVEAFVAELLRG